MRFILCIIAYVSNCNAVEAIVQVDSHTSASVLLSNILYHGFYGLTLSYAVPSQ